MAREEFFETWQADVENARLNVKAGQNDRLDMVTILLDEMWGYVVKILAINEASERENEPL